MPLPAITPETYGTLDDAYRFFNARLWAGTLPALLITLQRRRGASGSFAPERFSERQGATASEARQVRSAHELTLNPDAFTGRSDREVVSILVHNPRPHLAAGARNPVTARVPQPAVVRGDAAHRPPPVVDRRAWRTRGRATHAALRRGRRPVRDAVAGAGGDPASYSAGSGPEPVGRARADARRAAGEQDAVHVPAVRRERLGQAARVAPVRPVLPIADARVLRRGQLGVIGRASPTIRPLARPPREARAPAARVGNSARWAAALGWRDYRPRRITTGAALGRRSRRVHGGPPGVAGSRPAVAGVHTRRSCRNAASRARRSRAVARIARRFPV